MLLVTTPHNSVLNWVKQMLDIKVRFDVLNDSSFGFAS